MKPCVATNLLSAALALTVAAPASAALYAYDGVDYTAGTGDDNPTLQLGDAPVALPDFNTGIGWAGAWHQLSGYDDVANSGLDGPRDDVQARGFFGPVLDQPSGLAVTNPGSNPATFQLKGTTRVARQMSSTVGGAGSTTYVGLSMEANDTTNNNIGIQLRSGGLQGTPVMSLWQEFPQDPDTGEKDILGVQAGDPFGTGDPDPADDADNTTWDGFRNASGRFYLLEIVDDGVNATVSGKRYSKNDSLTGLPASWDFTGVTLPSFTFDSVAIFDNQAENDDQSIVWWDELRVASDINDFVNLTNPIPEPGSAVLLALGAGAALTRRRSR